MLRDVDLSQSIIEWLTEISLDQYAHTFVDNDIDLDVLPDLTESDLEKLGVASMGHRKRLLRAVQDQSAPPTPPTPSVAPEAECRQLTVMFCDLVGSTSLSESLDPEDLRDLNKAYQQAVAAQIERFDGFVARCMGDGILAYFGYPQAHENDAERSVRAGLAIQEAARDLRNRFFVSHGAQMGARVGIATGLVVVGNVIGHGASRESPVVGQTPNLAARLEALATPGTVVVSPVTKSLLSGLFDCSDLGPHQLKGITGDINAWQILGESSVEARHVAAQVSLRGKLIGRNEELATLKQAWASSCRWQRAGRACVCGARPQKISPPWRV
jgi:class 3 adenylate cyclase